MWAFVVTALAAPEVQSSHVWEGDLAARVAAGGPADFALLYAGEQRADQGTCGCPHDPRGSLGRVEAYREALVDAGVPTLLLNPGGWLDDTTVQGGAVREDAALANTHMLAAVTAGSWDALHVAYPDLIALPEGWRGAALVSANARGVPGVEPWLLREVGGHRVAITGVTHWGRSHVVPDGIEQRDPVEALQALLPSMRAEAELVVVMTYGLGKRAREVSALGVDVLIEADGLTSRLGAVADGQTVWARSSEGAKFIGELRLEVQGGITAAHDRAIDLDAEVPWPRTWRTRHRRSARAVRRAERALFPR